MLVTYDYLITLEKEVHRIWSSNWTGPKLLFLLNRYLIIGYAAVSLTSLNSDKVRSNDSLDDLPIMTFSSEVVSMTISLPNEIGLMFMAAAAFWQASRKLS